MTRTIGAFAALAALWPGLAFAHHMECRLDRICVEAGCEAAPDALTVRLSDTPEGILLSMIGGELEFRRIGPASTGPFTTLASVMDANSESALLTLSVDGPMVLTLHKAKAGALQVTSTFGSCVVTG